MYAFSSLCSCCGYAYYQKKSTETYHPGCSSLKISSFAYARIVCTLCISMNELLARNSMCAFGWLHHAFCSTRAASPSCDICWLRSKIVTLIWETGIMSCR
jgi:hypothetical protein